VATVANYSTSSSTILFFFPTQIKGSFIPKEIVINSLGVLSRWMANAQDLKERLCKRPKCNKVTTPILVSAPIADNVPLSYIF
jgi:hypothetical protein